MLRSLLQIGNYQVSIEIPYFPQIILVIPAEIRIAYLGK